MPYKIRIGDDHTLVRKGLGLLVPTLSDGARVSTAGNVHTDSVGLVAAVLVPIGSEALRRALLKILGHIHK